MLWGYYQWCFRSRHWGSRRPFALDPTPILIHFHWYLHNLTENGWACGGCRAPRVHHRPESMTGILERLFDLQVAKASSTGIPFRIQWIPYVKKCIINMHLVSTRDASSSRYRYTYFPMIEDPTIIVKKFYQEQTQFWISQLVWGDSIDTNSLEKVDQHEIKSVRVYSWGPIELLLLCQELFDSEEEEWKLGILRVEFGHQLHATHCILLVEDNVYFHLGFSVSECKNCRCGSIINKQCPFHSNVCLAQFISDRMQLSSNSKECDVHIAIGEVELQWDTSKSMLVSGHLWRMMCLTQSTTSILATCSDFRGVMYL